MAKIKTGRKVPPSKIEVFLGLNEDTSAETELQLGESPDMTNWRITENFKLQKREGYEEVVSSIAASPVKGQGYGKVNGSNYHLIACNGSIYKRDMTTTSTTANLTSIGTVTDDTTSFFVFDEKFYMLNGHEYKYWVGNTASFATVSGYRPLIAISTPPSGGGTLYEEVNLLNGIKHQQFNPTGTASTYQLAETAINSLDYVLYADATLSTASYSVNTTSGIVSTTFTASAGENTIDIGWTKGNGNRSEIEGNYFSMLFGGENDTRVHVYGDGSNRYYFTGLADGVPSAEYFPENNYNEIGSKQHQITDIVRQYDRQIIYTDADTYYSYYDQVTDDSGNTVVAFPVYPLNSVKGNKAKGQTRIILNDPFTVFDGIYKWVATNVRDERNAVYMSKRVQPSMDSVDLSQAVTVDWEEKGEYWLAVGTTVWVYNYRNDTWYKFILHDQPTNFIVIDGELYFGTTNGEVMKFDKSLKKDNGEIIDADWEMGFYNFGEAWLQKFANRLWLGLKPEINAQVKVTWQTDKGSSTETKEATYRLANFTEVDFNHFSFLTNYNPQAFRFKIRAKKFVYLKIILTNDTDDTATVLFIDILSRFGGEAK